MSTTPASAGGAVLVAIQAAAPTAARQRPGVGLFGAFRPPAICAQGGRLAMRGCICLVTVPDDRSVSRVLADNQTSKLAAVLTFKFHHQTAALS